jgi:hypothetical protein
MKTIVQKFLRIALIVSLVFASIGYFLVLGPIHSFHNNFISYFMLITGIVLIVLFGIVLLIASFVTAKIASIKKTDKFLKILRDGTKFTIDLDTVRIKSNNWESSRFIESHFYDIEVKEHNIVTILEFDLEIRGQKKTFHWPSKMEPKSLEMYFAMQKETAFYLDPKDHTKFYLDLSFI